MNQWQNSHIFEFYLHRTVQYAETKDVIYIFSRDFCIEKREFKAL